jgi:hypothetical protein
MESVLGIAKTLPVDGVVHPGLCDEAAERDPANVRCVERLRANDFRQLFSEILDRISGLGNRRGPMPREIVAERLERARKIWRGKLPKPVINSPGNATE